MQRLKRREREGGVSQTGEKMSAVHSTYPYTEYIHTLLIRCAARAPQFVQGTRRDHITTQDTSLSPFYSPFSGTHDTETDSITDTRSCERWLPHTSLERTSAVEILVFADVV